MTDITLLYITQPTLKRKTKNRWNLTWEHNSWGSLCLYYSSDVMCTL